VLALAHAMEAHKTVSGDDVAAIIEGHQGPIVDGRIYHDPEFQERLEEYHEAALRAHQEFARKVSIPLPKMEEPIALQPVAYHPTQPPRPPGGNGRSPWDRPQKPKPPERNGEGEPEAR